MFRGLGSRNQGSVFRASGSGWFRVWYRCRVWEIRGPSFESHGEDCDIFGSVLGPPVDAHPHIGLRILANVKGVSTNAHC